MTRAAELHLTRPFAADDFAQLRDLQLDGCDLRTIATYTDRTRAEVDLALHVKLGRTPERAAEILNKLYRVRPPTGGGRMADSPGRGLRRFLDGLFGRGAAR